MVKRKCGTCRHFKDGGIAGSGWCQHLARKEIQHMVLVRKTELACRNSWDQDLWEVADMPIDIQSSAHIPMPVSGGEPQDVTFVRAELPDDATRAGEMFTDRITSISMPTRSQLRPQRAESVENLAESDGADAHGARSSVREARKRRQEQKHLERKKHQATVLKRVDDLMDTSAPADDGDRDVARIRAVDGPLTSNHDRRQDPPSTRERRRQDVPAPDPAARKQPPAASVEFSAVPPTFRDANPSTPVVPNSAPVAPPQRQPENGANTPAHAKSTFESGGTEPLNTAAVRAAVRKRHEPRAEAVDVQPPPVALARPKSEPAVEKPALHAAQPVVGRRPTKWPSNMGNTAPVAPEHVAPEPLAVDPIDLSRDLQTVRRCCATCRDFKQVGDGRSGWCNNPYAFSQRRMVQSNEIACRTSLGVWWLPHDDLWLEHADTTHHGRPTPLLDEMVGVVPAARQGMGQRSS